MSATNSTTNYNLPIFIASDSPKWLVDWNGAMNTIDSAINTVATAASGAAGDITSLQSDLQTLSGTVTTQGTSISTLTSSLSTLTGTVNTITSLIGNGEPTTTDKTIIGAINELHSDIQQIVVSVDADDVSYDNTTSGLLATNVQSAIDELAASTPTPTPASRDKKVIIIADSYGMRNTPNFCTILEALDPSTYVECDATSGSGYTRNDWYDRIDAIAANMSATEKAAITDICFCGGWNDAWMITDGTKTLAELKARIVATHAHALSIFTNAICHPVFMGWQSQNPTQTDVNFASLISAREAYQTADVKAGVFSNVEYIMHDVTNMDATLFHPNAVGGQKIADAINAYIFNGDYNYSNVIDYATGTHFDVSLIQGTPYKFKAAITNGVTKLECISASVQGSLTGGILLKFKATDVPFVNPSKDNIVLDCLFNGSINGNAVTGYIPLLLIFGGVSTDQERSIRAYYNGAAITSIDGIIQMHATFDNTQCC